MLLHRRKITMGSLNIAIITNNTLTYLGVKLLLRDIPSVAVCRIDGSSAFGDGNPDRFDVLITDVSTCIAHIDFFLPRRSKTMIIADTEIGDSSFAHIDTRWSVDALSGKLADFVELQQHSTSPQTELSQREIEVLTLVASGKINKEIADALQISINTVLTHRKNISAKLGIKSVSGLSVYAMMNGYLK